MISHFFISEAVSNSNTKDTHRKVFADQNTGNSMLYMISKKYIHLLNSLIEKIEQSNKNSEK